ncbi:hypothetical protein [Gilliamella sp. wkB112]|uniref:hypothetical protein n=1 Tax=Gilliamella sp. wkB112 TaxID=3120257 RepID=UPI00080EC54F|nr:hypothetical protein [Gilliamella apicola]OCG02995.1 hypothetical protein A9G12_08715 [Gilliamella apicola]
MCTIPPVNDYYVVGYQDEQQAAQFVTIVRAELLPKELEHIITLLKQGKVLIDQKNYQQSINLFDQGIKQLGDRYISDQLDDDTETKLTLANVEQQRGNIEQAAHIKYRILDSRLQEYINLQRSKTQKAKF